MADDQLNLKAGFKDNASAGVRKLGKALEAVRPSHGMAAAQKWMEGFHKGADKTVAAIRPVSGMLNSVGVGGLAASLSIGEMIKQFKELADSTLTMRELGRQARISATDIARLQFAAGRMHVDPAAMNGAIGSWSSKMVEFRMHTSQFYRDLMRQNQDVAAKIESDSPVEGLKRAMDFISRIKDSQIQKRWADDAGLGDLMPLFAKGPEGLAAAFAEAGREVKPITQEMQEAADRFNEATNRFNQTWSNFKNDLGPSILDPLSHTLDKLDEGMKWAAKYPGDAAAAAATIAGSFAALYARHRIMRGSKLAGGSELGAAAGEIGVAAKEQAKAGSTLLEAAVELKAAAAELRARGGGTAGGASPAEGGKPGGPGGRSPGFADLTFRGLLAGLNLYNLADGMPDQLRRAETDGVAVDDSVGREAGWGDTLRRLFRGGATAGDAFHPDDDRLSRARAGASNRATDTDGNALRRGDETPVASMPAHELFATVREGSKEGIIAGLREMAQQQELAGGPGSGTGEGAGDLGRGLPSMRYGRGASGAYRHTPGQKYDLSEGGIGSRALIAGGLFKAKAPGIAARLKQDFPGLSDEDSAAILGNLGHESAGFKEFEEAHGKGPGRGWAQWTDPGRKARFFQFAKEHELDPHSDDANYGFLRWELTHTHKAAMTALRNAQGLRAKTRAFEGVFEGAGVKNYPSRDRYADSALAAIHGAPAAPAVPGAGTPAPSTATVTDAERFAAAQRILNGGRDPKDRALIERYKAQQAQPQRRAAGGPIRGPGGPRSDSIPAWLSNGEFVVNAGAAGRFLPWLHAINDGRMPAFADGGPVGFGVDKRFYPKFTPAISAEEGRSNRRSWLNFFQRPSRLGGMGASRSAALGATAMMNGETGWNLNSNMYGWDVNGPSGGAAQWHDVTEGRWAGKLHRLTDLMTFAARQHADWHDRTIQQAFWKKEATGSLSGAWHAMRLARMAAGTLRHGINLFENPADHEGELRRRLPNIARLAREDAGGGRAADADPVQIDIHHHPRTGAPIVTARGGRGAKLGIRTAPTMRPT